MVIPIFNEAKNIPLLLEKLNQIVSEVQFDMEVIIVDGCSTDTSNDILKKLFKDLNPENFKLVLQSERLGYGHDIIEGLKSAKHNVLAWSHADMQTDINDVVKGFTIYSSLLSERHHTKFIVKGHREGRPFFDVMLTLGMEIFTLLLLKIKLKEINAQPKIFSREFFNLYLGDCSPRDFSLDLYMLINAKKNKYKFHSFPVQFHQRLYGESKGGGGSLKNRLYLIKRTLKYILKLRKEINKNHPSH